MVDKTEKVSLRESVLLAEDKLKGIKTMYQNYRENSETLQDDAQCMLADTEMWIERTRRVHEEARVEKERHRYLRKHVNALERELAQSSQFSRNDRKLPLDGNFKNKENSFITERVLATFATCVGSVFVYGLFKLTAPFLI